MTNETMKDGERAAFEALPKGWKLVRVNQHFDALIEALEHAESKGYLPDALKEEWASFACDENVDARAAAPQAALTDEQIEGIARTHLVAGDDGEVFGIVKFARDLLATAPTERMSDEVIRMREALAAINVIRNSIIGTHVLYWSEHVYPLVAALDAAGFEGMGYPEAREFFGTMLDRCNAAEDDAERYRWLRKQLWNESSIFVVACHHSAVRLGTDCPSVERLDEAIDTARKAEIESARSAGGEA
ncbi:MAG: hypothetical protein V4793_45925 [Paraburkholderia tropica]